MFRLVVVLLACSALPLAAADGADGLPAAAGSGCTVCEQTVPDARLRRPCRPLRMNAAEALEEAASPICAAPAARTALRMLAANHVTTTQFDRQKKAFLARGEVVTNVIDVMVAFDKGAERWVRENWNGDVQGYAVYCVDRMNQVLVNSGLDGYFTFNLVAAPVIDIEVREKYAAPNPYSPGATFTDYSSALEDAVGKTSAGRNSAGMNLAAWKALRAERELATADVVSILIDDDETGTVGLAWVLDNVCIQYPDFMSDVAYSMVCIGAAHKDYTQVHEIGHLMGAGHSDLLDTSEWDPELLGPQLFPYSASAYFNAAFASDSLDDWRYTVMGYNYPGPKWKDKDGYEIFAKEEPCFSSPDLISENGVPKGDETRDNARTLRETYAMVANYRVRKVALRVEAPGGGGTVSGAGAYASGKAAKLVAKPSKGFAFAGWYLAYDAVTGEFSRPLEGAVDYRTETLMYTVGTENTTVYARFVEFAADAEAISLAEAGQTFTTDSGEASFCLNVDSMSLPKVSVKGLPQGMKFNASTLTITGRPTKPGAFPVTVSLTNASIKKAVAFSFTINVVFPVVKVVKDGSGTGKVTGEGPYAEGKKVTLKATADKGSVFMGWYEIGKTASGNGGVPGGDANEERPFSQAASLSFVMAKEDVEYKAIFITSTEDALAITATVGSLEFSAATTSAAVSVPCGVALRWPVAAKALSATTVKISGLPSGLKFTDKPVTAKVGTGRDAVVVTNVPANTIYGAPSAASKVDAKTNLPKPSSVKVTVTTAGKSSKTFVVDVVVNEMANWAVGTFNGGGAGGLATITVAASGKISGKILEGDKTWSLAADSFSRTEVPDSLEPPDSLGNRHVYYATVIAKAGKLLATNEITLTAEPILASDSSTPAYRGIVTVTPYPAPQAPDPNPSFTAWQNLWKIEPWKAMSAKFAKAPALGDVGIGGGAAQPGVATLKFASSGAVTANGVFITGYDNKKQKDITYSASCSSVLIPATYDGAPTTSHYDIFLYFPPKPGKFGGCATKVGVKWNGSSFERK